MERLKVILAVVTWLALSIFNYYYLTSLGWLGSFVQDGKPLEDQEFYLSFLSWYLAGVELCLIVLTVFLTNGVFKWLKRLFVNRFV